MKEKPTYEELERRVHELKTDNTQLENKLLEVRSLNEEIMTHMTEGLVLTDTRETVVFINQRLSEMLGYPPEEITGKCWLDMVAVEQQTIAHEAKARRAHGHIDRYEIVLRRKSGEKFSALIGAGPRFGKLSGQYIGSMAVVTDITERKQTEETLHESEEKFRALFEKAPIGIAFHKMVYDDSGKAIDYRFLDANSSYLELTGVDPRGKCVTEAFPGIENDPFDWIGTFGGVAKTGEQIRFEQYLQPNKRWYDCVGYQVKPDFFITAFVEITERKQAEKLLNSSQRLSKVGGWGWNVETQTMWWTKETYRIHGFTPGETEPGSTEHINKSVACYEPEDRPVILAAFHRCVEEGQPYDLELPFTTAKGRRLWVRTTARPERARGKIIGVIGNIMDITERRQVEEKLRVSEEKFRSIYEHTAVGLAQVSLDFKIMSVNEAYCNMLGYQKKDLAGRHLKEITHPDVIEENIQKQVKLASGNIDHYRMEKKFIHKNGQTVHAILDANLIRDVSGKAIYFLGSVVDVTELKQAEMDLQSQKKLLEGVLDSIKDVIGVQLPDHTIVQYNRAGYELLGLTKDQVKGKKCYELLGRQAPCDICVTSRSLISRTLEKVEKYILELDRHFLCTSNPILDDDGNIKLIIEQLTDITEKKKIDEQLNQAKKMESVGRLAGGVAHDFNNMLGVILGHTEMALEEIDPGVSLYENLQAVQYAAQHSADLTRQLLAFARKQAIAPKIIDLNETVEVTLNMLRRLIGEDINLLWQPGINLQPVKIDPAQIDQLLANLCVNARDAIDGMGTVTIETDAKTFDEDYCHDHPGSLPGEYVLLEVSDDGCGMDKKTLNHIFEPFFTTKEQGKGTGLGLASIYGIVKQNNGFINVYSEPDQGTTIKIYLPVYVAKSVEVAEKAHDLPTEYGNETILLVEDESAILKMTTTMLERLGYTVVVATTPGEAIRLAHECRGRIDLLMTDVVMPEMNGRQLARNLLSHYPDLKRLFMSGYTADVIAHHGVLDEGVHFIQKPFSKKDLGEKLREALEV